MQRINFAFFGTGNISIIVLEELRRRGFLPKLVVTTPDKPQGRRLILTPTPTKVWAQKENVPFIELTTLKKLEAEQKLKKYSKDGYDLFIVASYGKIIPKNILDIPKYKTLNVHPSLLPKLRGASPIKSAILEENETGVTIIQLDEEVDHGPIVAQEKVTIADWPPYDEDLEKILGQAGGEILGDIIPDWISGKIKAVEQRHVDATYCKKIEKSDGEINLEDKPEINLRKIRAYHVWPGAYFFKNDKRVIVKKASIKNDKLVIERVVPEGKKEMSYDDFLRGLKN